MNPDIDERHEAIEDANAADDAPTKPASTFHDELSLCLSSEAHAAINQLVDAFVTIGCHAVANLHPESLRDIPAEALRVAAKWLPTFSSDPRAAEIAYVWKHRAQLVEEWREKRGLLGSEVGQTTPNTPFPTAVAAGYLKKTQGNAGIFDGAVGTDANGQAVPLPRNAAPPTPMPTTSLSPAVVKRLAALRASMAPGFGADVDGLNSYMQQVENVVRGIQAMADDPALPKSRRKATVKRKPPSKKQAAEVGRVARSSGARRTKRR